ncbi:MAG TPA: hypothetical protein VFG04_29655 [Planctomycetaceae bacterium]|jgi:hypothetical protein|nr:hypothetical protein [Planctomycetaceae bacterium]
MLEAVLEPVEACASRTPAVPLSGNYRPTGAPPDEHVLTILRGIPEVECLLGGVVASWHSSLASLHSRRWHRVAYDKPLLITPLDDLTERPSEPDFWVQARDLSLAGISFCHPRPLASRKVIIQFPAEDPSAGEGILAILRWCRFRRDGSYQSGGQFVRSAVLNATYPTAESEYGSDQFRADRSAPIECLPAF